METMGNASQTSTFTSLTGQLTCLGKHFHKSPHHARGKATAPMATSQKRNELLSPLFYFFSSSNYNDMLVQ